MKYSSFIFGLILLTLFACKEPARHDKQIQKENEQQTIQVAWEEADSLVFDQIMKYSINEKLQDKTLPEIEIAIANFFMGTPYVGKTLEMEGEEQLVINLRGMDCTTFLENVLSLSLCVRDQKTNFEDYCRILTEFRYRDGIIDGYPSRLHYFTDWLTHNEKKGLLSIISNSLEGDVFDPSVNWMSTHPDFYAQLENDTFLQEIAIREKGLSTLKLVYISESKLNDLAHHIQNGDLIAITTTVKGLDIAHVGLAYFVEGKLHLFHASSKEKAVVISKKPLVDYLHDYDKRDGIIVARLW